MTDAWMVVVVAAATEGLVGDEGVVVDRVG